MSGHEHNDVTSCNLFSSSVNVYRKFWFFTARHILEAPAIENWTLPRH